MGVKSGCRPRVDVLRGELDDAIFAASFDKLTRGEGPLIYRDPALFFRNTHPTAALSKLCRDVFGRMASSTDSGTVLRLSTGFGGGKHTVLVITDPKDQPAGCHERRAAEAPRPRHRADRQRGGAGDHPSPVRPGGSHCGGQGVSLAFIISRCRPGGLKFEHIRLSCY